jgi:molecular chaperone GrpE
MSKDDVTQDPVTEETSPELEAELEQLSVEELKQKVRELSQALAEAQARAEENWEALLREKAAQENLRRRHERELEKAHKYALENFAQELLPIIDSLEMGVKAAAQEGATLDKVREGTELTLKMLLNVLDKFGIRAVHPEGEPFNPELHQAMSLLESPDHAPHTVMDVMQKGYTLNDRLIRPAMVVVSKEAGGEAGGQPSGSQPSPEPEEAEKGTNVDEKA